MSKYGVVRFVILKIEMRDPYRLRRLFQSHRKLALYYCYIFVLNCRECNSVDQQDQQDREKQRQQGRYAEPDEWVVRLEGGSEVASLLALRSGYAHIGPVSFDFFV